MTSRSRSASGTSRAKPSTTTPTRCGAREPGDRTEQTERLVPVCVFRPAPPETRAITRLMGMDGDLLPGNVSDNGQHFSVSPKDRVVIPENETVLHEAKFVAHSYSRSELFPLRLELIVTRFVCSFSCRTGRCTCFCGTSASAMNTPASTSGSTPSPYTHPRRPSSSSARTSTRSVFLISDTWQYLIWDADCSFILSFTGRTNLHFTMSLVSVLSLWIQREPFMKRSSSQHEKEYLCVTDDLLMHSAVRLLPTNAWQFH